MRLRKRAIWIVAFLVTWLGLKATRPASLFRGPASISNVQAGSSDCNISNLATEIHEGERTPAKKIYHFGRKEILFRNINAHTVPLEDWNEFIMGQGTRFSLKSFRRGLYGTEFLEDADKYGSSKFNWAMEIVLKDSCLSPEKISTLEHLSEQTVFRKWFERKNRDPKSGLNESWKEWIKVCFLSSGQPDPTRFSLYESSEPQEQNICEKVVEEYWNEMGIKILQDTLENRSWYIRDRNCIEDINGVEIFWAEEFLKNGAHWNNQCDKFRTHRNLVRIWFASLSALSAAQLNLLDFESFNEMLKRYQMPETKGDEEFSAGDFAIALSLSKKRCEITGGLDFWKKSLSEITKEIEDLNSRVVRERLDQLCR